MNTEFDELILWVNEQGFQVEGIKIDPRKLIFEERVKINCFYCAKYNTNWKCPPNIPKLNYAKALSEFKKAAFVYIRMSLYDNDYDTVRKNSSLQLHRALLMCEKWLYQHNNSIALSFIGGSCKLCKNSCAPGHCANPYQARIPVEALGINVVESARQYGLEIRFPPTEYMMRVGLLLW